MIIPYALPISLSGLCWANKTGIFILGTLSIMTVDKNASLYFDTEILESKS